MYKYYTNISIFLYILGVIYNNKAYIILFFTKYLRIFINYLELILMHNSTN